MKELKDDPLYQDLKKRIDDLESKIDNITNLILQKDGKITYPEFVKKYYKSDTQHTSALSAFKPDIQSDLDERMYKESQSCTGGEFSAWHGNLTAEERESYKRIYGH